MDTIQELSHLLTMTCVVLTIPALFRAFIPYPFVQNAETPKKSLGRITAFDGVRGVAIIAVILIHVSEILAQTNVGASKYFLDALNTLMRFCIPVFFIASGALLTPFIREAGTYRAYLTAKVVRIAVPYILVTAVLTGMQGGGFREFITHSVTGGASVPLYFVLILFQFYVLYPFIERYAHTRFFVIASFGLTLITSFSSSVYFVAGVPLCIPYTFFFVWGIYMRPLLLAHVRPNLWPFVWIVCLSVLVYILFPGHYYNIRPYYGVALFMLLFAFFTHSHCAHIKRFFGWLGTFTLWVFLTHYPLLEYVIPKMLMPESPVWAQVVLICLMSVTLSIVFGYICTRAYKAVSDSLVRLIQQKKHRL